MHGRRIIVAKRGRERMGGGGSHYHTQSHTHSHRAHWLFHKIIKLCKHRVCHLKIKIFHEMLDFISFIMKRTKGLVHDFNWKRQSACSVCNFAFFLIELNWIELNEICGDEERCMIAYLWNENPINNHFNPK